MPNLLQGLEIGRQALSARQSQISVVGNNIANADNTSFHRQDAVVQAGVTIRTVNGEFGTGVSVTKVVRVYNAAMEASLRDATAEQSYYSSYGEALNAIESRLAPNGESLLADSVTSLMTNLQEATANPHMRDVRLSLLQAARQTTTQIKADHSTLSKFRDAYVDSSGNGMLKNAVDEINSLATKVAELNDSIAGYELNVAESQPALLLRDQRDELVSRLAELTGATATEQSDGTYLVKIGSENLVSTNVARSLALDTSGSSPVVEWSDTSAAATTDTGEVGAYIASYNYLTSRMTDLDTYAAALISTFNTAQAAGFDLDGNAGTALFSGTNASTIGVAISDNRLLALSDTAGETANGKNASAMLGQMTTAQAALGNQTFAEWPDALADKVALDAVSNNHSLEVADASVTMYREAVRDASGVSIDEEMVNMLQLQRSYQAAARFVNAVDEMLQAALAIV